MASLAPQKDNEVQLNDSDHVHVSNALNLSWSFGINQSIPALNLSTASRKVIFYTTAHTGVVYNFNSNEQMLYQGHCNAISCCCVSEDKRWLATADIGPSCMLIVWDTDAGVPVRTLFDVNHKGTAAVAMSAFARYIVTLSCQSPQVVAVWDWTTELDSPIASMTLAEELALQSFVRFHWSDCNLFVANSEHQVTFYEWETGVMKWNAPSLTDRDFNKTVGLYSQSVFQPKSTFALTATMCGNVVCWGDGPSGMKSDRKAVKIVKLQEKPITVLTLSEELIVTGDAAGIVKFYDSTLKLTNWYSKLGCHGAINSISFTHASNAKEDRTEDASSKSSTLDGDFVLGSEFTVSTTGSTYLYFQPGCNEVQFIKQEHEHDIRAIACHPFSPYLAIAGFDGLLQIFDYEAKTVLHRRQFEGPCLKITSLAYSRSGDNIALGFEDGTVVVVDSTTLEHEGAGETVARFTYSRDSVLHLRFSRASEYLACADKDRCVVVYTGRGKDKIAPWQYLGKHRTHYKDIQDLLFMDSLDGDQPRLLSLGKDRMLVEYDLLNSSLDNLIVLNSTRIEQEAVPTCFAHYPPVVKEDFLLIANDQFKLKLFNTTTKMCRKTVLGPTYGSAVQRLVVLPLIEKAPHRYLAYVNADKVGIVILPLDGNPYKSMALIAHPGKVHSLACSFDGKFIFTAGGSDKSVLMWDVNINALEATAVIGGNGLSPFYGLLEGGERGQMFADFQDYFYYAQMRSQGVDSMDMREVSTEIPLEQVPFVVRALGYYPSEQEVENMINEVKFSEYVDTGHCKKSINLEELIKLYINHRPAFGLRPEEMHSAFEKIGYIGEDGEGTIDRSELLIQLQERGEHLTEDELADYIALLLGVSDIAVDSDEISHAQSTRSLQDHLPEQISASFFASEILGLPA